MRRAVLLFAAMTATLLLASGMALAAVLTGTEGPDALAGTVDDDSITGRSGDDLVTGGSGNDEVSGTLGRDAVSGGEGRDIVDDAMDAFNDPAVSDVVACGPGDDRAYTDGTDLIAGDCGEIVRGPHPDAWDRSPFQPAPLKR